MEVILREDIKGLGYKNDIVTVKPGYGRNFLISHGMAVLANRSNRKMIQENIRQAAHKAEKLQKDAEDLVEQIGELVLEIRTKAGESGKIFGSVTAIQVSDKLKEKGFDIDRKKITVGNIKEVGQHSAELDLHKKVQHKITLNVVAE